ncbi:MAG: TIGR02186 family protein, partial [Variibacter sp.]|nr:TIGR02186 family protein [Variibacter sp.]
MSAPRRVSRLIAVALPLLLAAAPARAERLVVSLSTHRVLISSNFTGVELTLFGAVEPDARSVGRTGGYAVVATITGPRQTTVTWRKERVLGIWANAESRTFVDPPSFLAVLSNRPVDSIAAPDTLRRFRVGTRYFQLPQRVSGDVGEVSPDDPFRQAFIRAKTQQGLYRERANGITFITPALFRAAIPLPANVLVGDYEVDVKLFADGAMIASETSAFEIVKTGFEQIVAQGAR